LYRGHGFVSESSLCIGVRLQARHTSRPKKAASQCAEKRL
jgi:hypothetical protein